MVNLVKSGKKLYYALALIKHVAERMRPEARIGVLYDIACNLKQHIQKRELLPNPCFTYSPLGQCEPEAQSRCRTLTFWTRKNMWSGGVFLLTSPQSAKSLISPEMLKCRGTPPCCRDCANCGEESTP